MKKKLILIFLAGTFSVFSQEIAAKESSMSLGVEGGFTLNKFRTSGGDAIGLDFNNKSAFVAGVNFSYNFLNFLNVKASVNYENKGAKFVNPYYGFGFGGVEIRYNFNYINLPIVVSYRYQISKLNIHAGLGPNVSYLLGANAVSNYGDSESITSDCNSIDFGVVGEAGVNYTFLSKFMVDLSFREVFGLTNAISNPTTDAVFRTNSMGLILGFMYKL